MLKMILRSILTLVHHIKKKLSQYSQKPLWENYKVEKTG